MEKQSYTKDGRTIEYFDDGDTIRLVNPADPDDVRTFSKSGTADYIPGSPEYQNCIDGCYNFPSGDPGSLAYCLSLCCFG